MPLYRGFRPVSTHCGGNCSFDGGGARCFTLVITACDKLRGGEIAEGRGHVELHVDHAVALQHHLQAVILCQGESRRGDADAAYLEREGVQMSHFVLDLEDARVHVISLERHMDEREAIRSRCALGQGGKGG